MRNRVTQKRATELRKRMTDAERYLWHHLRKRNLYGRRFRRQVPIGPFIADFASLEDGLVIEVDGGQHGTTERDLDRDRYLREQGFTILRFWNNEVLGQTEAVLETICGRLRTPPSYPSPAMRGKERRISAGRINEADVAIARPFKAARSFPSSSGRIRARRRDLR